jgi:hypothetical protein
VCRIECLQNIDVLKCCRLSVVYSLCFNKMTILEVPTMHPAPTFSIFQSMQSCFPSQNSPPDPNSGIHLWLRHCTRALHLRNRPLSLHTSRRLKLPKHQDPCNHSQTLPFCVYSSFAHAAATTIGTDRSGVYGFLVSREKARGVECGWRSEISRILHVEVVRNGDVLVCWKVVGGFVVPGGGCG